MVVTHGAGETEKACCDLRKQGIELCGSEDAFDTEVERVSSPAETATVVAEELWTVCCRHHVLQHAAWLCPRQTLCQALKVSACLHRWCILHAI